MRGDTIGGMISDDVIRAIVRRFGGMLQYGYYLRCAFGGATGVNTGVVREKR